MLFLMTIMLFTIGGIIFFCSLLPCARGKCDIPIKDKIEPKNFGGE